MTTYPKANTQAAWYEDNYPGRVIDPNCGVIHSTEGTNLPGYGGGATAPNYTAVPNFKAKRLDWFAHFPDERSSRALRNLAGGVETNTANVLQVELVGTCDPRTRDNWVKAGRVQDRDFIFWPRAPKWALDDIADFIAWCNVKHGIPIVGPGKGRVWRAYPASYGAQSNRLTHARWRKFTGWCGHQHVPENTHGDPGAFDFGYVKRTAKSIVKAGAIVGSTKPKAKKADKFQRLRRLLLAAEKAEQKAADEARQLGRKTFAKNLEKRKAAKKKRRISFRPKNRK